MKIAIYTANIGGNVNNINDDLHHYEDGVDYYYFTDDRSIHSKKWKVVYVNNEFPSTKIAPGNRIFAKKVKMIYWEFLEGYDWVVWVDAHHVLKPSNEKNSIVGYINSLPENTDIVFKKHTGMMPMFDKTGKIIPGKLQRKYDLYDEIKHIKYHPNANLENITRLNEWEKHLKKKGLPRKSGLIETNKIIWRMNYNNICRHFNHVWFKCSTEKFRRDQLTINFLIWRDINISNYVKVDYLDTIIPTEKLSQEDKTQKGKDEWSGNWKIG